MESTLDLTLSLDQLNALIKAVSISVDKLATKLTKVDPRSHHSREVQNDYELLSEVLDELRGAQREALVGWS